MTELSETRDLPEGWQPVIAELVERNTLCAVNQLDNSEMMIRIVPIPTDRVVDYTHSHRVILETPEWGCEIVAKRKDVDDVLDAKVAVVEAMKRAETKLEVERED